MALDKETIIYNGDISECSKYLQFARKKLKELLAFTIKNRMPNITKKYIINDKVSFILKIMNNEYKTIIFYAEDRCNDVLSGILRNCQFGVVEGSLNSYYPKTGSSRNWVNLDGFGKVASQNIIDIGYNFGGKTQQAHIKASNYSGIMRFAIQKALGSGRQIGFNFAYNETDGIISESVRFENNAENTLHWISGYGFRYIKIRPDGIYLKKADNCIPNLVKSNIPVSYDPQNSDHFHAVMKDVRFDIPDVLSDNVNNAGTYKINIDLSAFYNKQPLFKSCGWLIPYSESNYIVNFTYKGFEETKFYAIFNTCYDPSTKISYLYGIKLKQHKISFSIEYMQSEEYLNNSDYNGKTEYYEYSATLHELKNGKMCNASSENTWINSNCGLYIPDIPNDQIKNFSLSNTVKNNPLDYAPLHIYRENNGGLAMLIDTQLEVDSYITDYEKNVINTYYAKNLTTVTLAYANSLTINDSTFSIGFIYNASNIIEANRIEYLDENGDTITDGTIQITSFSGYGLIPNYEREGVVFLKTAGNGSVFITYSLLNGTETSLSNPAIPIYEFFDLSFNRTENYGDEQIFNNSIFSSVSTNSSFKYEYIRDMFSSKYGYFSNGSEMVNMNLEYPITSLQFLNFIGKP